MKRNFTRALMMSALAASVVSCAESGVQEQPIQDEKSQLVEVAVGASQRVDESGTRASYGSQGEFSWSVGDRIVTSYFIDPENSLAKKIAFLTTQEEGKSVSFEGDVFPFEGEKSIYAVYNTANIGIVSGSIDTLEEVRVYNKYLCGSSIIPTATSQVEANAMGYMVAVSDNATVGNDDTFNIPTFEFSQVASFFQVEIQNHPADETIFSISLMPTQYVEPYIYDEDVTMDKTISFIDSACASMRNGEITKELYFRSNIQVEVASDYNKANPFYTMPLLPRTINEPLSVVLEVASDDGSYYMYSYEVCSGVEFKRNTIHRKSGVDWADMTKYTIAESITLDRFDDPDFLPSGTGWIVNTDKELLEASDLNNLRRALSGSDLEAGSIQMELHGVSAFGANALCADDTYDNHALGVLYLDEIDSIGDRAFADNTNLRALYSVTETVADDGSAIPLFTQLGTGVFAGCYNMRSCYVLLNEIPEMSFYGCTALSSVNLWNVTSIGDSAFEYCASLFLNVNDPDTSSLVLPAIESIGSRAFYNCTQIKVLRINENSDKKTLSFVGSDVFSSNSEGSYTPSIKLYVSSPMQDNVDYKTFTVGDVSLEFLEIYVNGVLQTDGSSAGSGAGGSGEDANIEDM